MTWTLFFCQKEDNFSIKSLGCLKKYLLPHILGNLSTINYYIIDFMAKWISLDTFSDPELAFSETSAGSEFSFWLYSSE